MTPRTYIDIHVLQTVPPSNLNRDDAGSPKQAVYGGVRRARVSSQAWKRATRRAFLDRDDVPVEQRGTRTARISTLLAGRMVERTGVSAEQAARLSTFLLEGLGVTAGKREAETAYLLFFGYAQLDAIVDLVAADAGQLVGLDDKALRDAVADRPVREQLRQAHPVDVALFGRMVADLPLLNVDAATQVAHALSTHAADIEFDYFTAVDDEKSPEESKGAAMIGTVEFTSATLYRYATLGVHQLAENLGNDIEATAAAVGTFVRSFVTSMPTGHRNTFAHQTLPGLVSVMVRDDQPVNLVSAFEQPIRGEGIAARSVLRLAEEAAAVRDSWGMVPLQVASQYRGEHLDAFGPALPFDQVVAAAEQAARDRLATGALM